MKRFMLPKYTKNVQAEIAIQMCEEITNNERAVNGESEGADNSVRYAAALYPFYKEIISLAKKRDYDGFKIDGEPLFCSKEVNILLHGISWLKTVEVKDSEGHVSYQEESYPCTSLLNDLCVHAKVQEGGDFEGSEILSILDRCLSSEWAADRIYYQIMLSLALAQYDECLLDKDRRKKLLEDIAKAAKIDVATLNLDDSEYSIELVVPIASKISSENEIECIEYKELDDFLRRKFGSIVDCKIVNALKTMSLEEKAYEEEAVKSAERKIAALELSQNDDAQELAAQALHGSTSVPLTNIAPMECVKVSSQDTHAAHS